jgi:hypothetical protein
MKQSLSSLAMLQTPPSQEMANDEDLDSRTCNEDEECFQARSEAEDMKEAISKCLDEIEEHDRCGFEIMHRFLAVLPVPVQKKDSRMTHDAALEEGFISEMD